MNYYSVKCKFGHVGRDKYLPLLVPVFAVNKKNASHKARQKRGIKKDHKDWCLEEPIEISFEEFQKVSSDFHSDIYFEKHSRQRLYLFKDRLKDEPHYLRMNDIKTNKKMYQKNRDVENIKFKIKKTNTYIKSLIQDQRNFKYQYEGMHI